VGVFASSASGGSHASASSAAGWHLSRPAPLLPRPRSGRVRGKKDAPYAPRFLPPTAPIIRPPSTPRNDGGRRDFGAMAAGLRPAREDSASMAAGLRANPRGLRGLRPLRGSRVALRGRGIAAPWLAGRPPWLQDRASVAAALPSRLEFSCSQVPSYIVVPLMSRVRIRELARSRARIRELARMREPASAGSLVVGASHPRSAGCSKSFSEETTQLGSHVLVPHLGSQGPPSYLGSQIPRPNYLSLPAAFLYTSKPLFLS